MTTTTTLGEIVEKHGGLIQTGPFGSQLHQSDYSEAGIPVVMPKDIRYGRVDETNVARIPETKARTLARHFLKPGSVVFPRRGEISKCAYIDTDQAGFLCGTGCIKIEPPEGTLRSRFLYYYLGLKQVVEWLERNAVGTTMLNLNTKILSELKVPLVPPPTQDSIASILSAYDGLIENNQRRIQLLEQAARLLYKEWFVHLRFPGHERVKIKHGVPEGWARTTAFDVMDVRSGGTPKTKISDYWDGEIRFFTPKDAIDCAYAFSTERTLTEEGLRNCNSKLYPKDTVFITARGTVGKINLAQTEMAISQSCYALIARPPIDQYFLYFTLIEGVEQLRSRAVGTVFDAIISDTFKLIPFIVPDSRLIQAFAESALPLLQQIAGILSATRKLTKARNLLLPCLMNGSTSQTRKPDRP